MLEGKTALVAGADPGIGRDAARPFEQNGAHLAITDDTDADGIAETARLVEETGRRALVIQNDVGYAASVTATVDRIAGDLGAIDIRVADAGRTT